MANIISLSFKEAATLMGCNALKREFATKSGEKFVSLYYTWSYEDQDGNPNSCLNFLHYSSNLGEDERNADWVIANRKDLAVYQVGVDEERGNCPILVVGRKADLGTEAGLEEDLLRASKSGRLSTYHFYFKSLEMSVDHGHL